MWGNLEKQGWYRIRDYLWVVLWQMRATHEAQKEPMWGRRNTWRMWEPFSECLCKGPEREAVGRGGWGGFDIRHRICNYSTNNTQLLQLLGWGGAVSIQARWLGRRLRCLRGNLEPIWHLTQSLKRHCGKGKEGRAGRHGSIWLKCLLKPLTKFQGQNPTAQN